MKDYLKTQEDVVEYLEEKGFNFSIMPNHIVYEMSAVSADDGSVYHIAAVDSETSSVKVLEIFDKPALRIIIDSLTNNILDYVENSATFSGTSVVSAITNIVISAVSHGNLRNLSADDHTQYVLVDGSRGFTGTVSGVNPVSGIHLVTKSYVDEIISNLDNVDLTQYVLVDGSRSFTGRVKGIDPIEDADLVTKSYADGLTMSGTVSAHAYSHEIGGSDLLDHDNLTNFVENEHIDHTSVVISAGIGLSGGGDISSNRVIGFDTVWGDSRYEISGSVSTHESTYDHTKLHDPVTVLDSSTINLSIVNQQLSADVITSGIDHNNLLNFSADAHIDHGNVILYAGDGLTGGGNIKVSRTFAVGAGTGIAVAADSVSLSHLGIESLTDPGADKIMFWDDSTSAMGWLTVSAGLSISGNSILCTITQYTDEMAQDAVGGSFIDSSSIDFSYNDTSNQISAVVIPAGVDHNSLLNYEANKHIDHTSVVISAGNGLSGGGNISTSFIISVGAGTGISVSSDSVSLSHLGIESLTDPGADRIFFWDESSNSSKWLTVGTGLSITDTTIECTITQYTDEMAQDAVGGIFVDSSTIDFTYNDASNQISATIVQSGIDHGSIGGLTGDHHIHYLLTSGTRALVGNWDAGSFQIRALTFYSDVSTGTAPFTISSTTLVSNLNADLLDGQHGSYYQVADADLSAIASLTGTGIASRTASNTWALTTGTSGTIIKWGTGGLIPANSLIIEDANGNIGFNKSVPEGTFTGYHSYWFGPITSIYSRKTETNGTNTYLLHNNYLDTDGSFKRIVNDNFEQYLMASGRHYWYYGDAGTADSAVIPTLMMNLTSEGLTISSIIAHSADTDRFIISYNGQLRYRTGAQMLSDIGAQASDADLTSIASLTGNGIAVRTSSDTWNIRTLSASTGISIVNENGVSGNPTISCTITQYTDEMAQDAVGGIFVDSSTIDFTYNDASNQISASVITSGINHSLLGSLNTLNYFHLTSANHALLTSGVIADSIHNHAALFESDNGAQAVWVNSIGKVIIGTSATIDFAGVAPKLQVYATDSNGSLNLGRWSNDSFGAYLIFGKSRGTSIGTNTIVQSADTIGSILWAVNDGTDHESYCASIRAIMDGIPGSNDVPGRLVLGTTPDGSSAPLGRIDISSKGNIGIGKTSENWSTSYTAIDMVGNGEIVTKSSEGTNSILYVMNNAYINSAGSFAFISPDVVTVYAQTSGMHIWYNNPYVDGADTTFTLYEIMRTDLNGYLGINCKNPTTYLTVGSLTNLYVDLIADIDNNSGGNIAGIRFIFDGDGGTGTTLFNVGYNQSLGYGVIGTSLSDPEMVFDTNLVGITSGTSLDFLNNVFGTVASMSILASDLFKIDCMGVLSLEGKDALRLYSTMGNRIEMYADVYMGATYLWFGDDSYYPYGTINYSTGNEEFEFYSDGGYEFATGMGGDTFRIWDDYITCKTNVWIHENDLKLFFGPVLYSYIYSNSANSLNIENEYYTGDINISTDFDDSVSNINIKTNSGKINLQTGNHGGTEIVLNPGTSGMGVRLAGYDGLGNNYNVAASGKFRKLYVNDDGVIVVGDADVNNND